MSTVLAFPKCPVPRQLGPVPTRLISSQVLTGPGGPVLELHLTVPLAAMPRVQRRPLAGLLRSSDPLTLTLTTPPPGAAR